MDVFIGCPLRSSGSLLYDDTNGFFWSAPGFLYNTNGSLNGFPSDRFNIRSCKTKLDLTDIKLDVLNFQPFLEWKANKMFKERLKLSIGKG